MRCETSFFSLTLYKKHLKRYWPMWAVWLVAWILAIPVTLWNEAEWADRARLQELVNGYQAILEISGVLIALAAPVVAVAVLFHLFRSPATNFVGALPLRREGVFATAFAAGYTMLTAPLIVVSLITLLVEWSLGVLAPASILSFLGGCMLQSFFWFSFAILCCVISGNMVASVCFYGIFNGVVVGMVWLVQVVLGIFLYGFDQFGQRVWNAAAWLTPVYNMAQSDYSLPQMGGQTVSRFEMLWVYAAVGFLMLLAALGLHHIRKAERAGDLIAFGPIRWIFRISVTLCGGLSFGLLLMGILFSGRGQVNEGAALAGCCAVAAAISWFVAEMLLQKSFKVFKEHWKGGLVAAVCFVLAICAIDMDWIGFTTRVPRPQQVRSAQAEFYGNSDPISNDGLTYDAETVGDLIALHQRLVEDRDSRASDEGKNYGRVEIEYDLGLTSMRRVYSFWYEDGDPLYDLYCAAQESGRPDFPIDRDTPHTGHVRWDYTGRDLTAQELEVLWVAIREDVEAGRYRPEPRGDWRSNRAIELCWVVGSRNTWAHFYPRSGTTSVNAAVEQLGLAESMEDVPMAETVEIY